MGLRSPAENGAYSVGSAENLCNSKTEEASPTSSSYFSNNSQSVLVTIRHFGSCHEDPHFRKYDYSTTIKCQRKFAEKKGCHGREGTRITTLCHLRFQLK